MIVVADSSPLNYLVQIGQIDLIPAFYEAVVVPEAVVAEMLHTRTPESVRSWITSPPAWLHIQRPAQLDPKLPRQLGAGERQAISLALQLRAGRILLDDRRARIAAIERSLQVSGTLTILSQAASAGWIDLPATIEHLLHLNFRASTALLDEALRAGKRNSS